MNENKFRCVNKIFGAPTLFMTDIVSMEVASEENVKKWGGTIGSVLVGGVLFGGVGAIVGAVGSGHTKETTLILTFKSGVKSLAVTNSDVMTAIRTHLFKAEQNPGYADVMSRKMALWKKICIAVFLFAILVAMFGEKKQKPSETGVVENPCANVKSRADWDNASSLWRMSNPECKPK